MTLPPAAAPLTDSGLEVTSFVCTAEHRTLAATLAPYADQPAPLPRAVMDLWEAHGLRILAIPADDAPALLARLQTSGGTQRQWLGQAFAWTEAAGARPAGERVIALDAERIRLAPGSLRLLVRAWLEPVPPPPAAGARAAGGPAPILRIELLPQNRELAPIERSNDALAFAPPRIEAESQGLLFARLLASASLTPGRALVILAEHPGTDWRTLAARPSPQPRGTPDNQGAPASQPLPGPTPRVGQIMHAKDRGAAPTPSAVADAQPDESEAGPSDAGVPTLGEAMLNTLPPRTDPRTPARVQRTILLLTPRLPAEFRLIAPQPPAPPAPTPAAPPRPR